MIDRVTLERIALLREMVAEYERALETAESQLDHLAVERTVLQFCVEFLREHGQSDECRELLWEIRATARRVNALDNTLIPRLREELRYIRAVLEEREREDVFRLKRVKRVLARNRPG